MNGNKVDEKTREMECKRLEEIAVEFSRLQLTRHAERLANCSTIEIDNQVSSPESDIGLLSELFKILRQTRSRDDRHARVRLARLAYAFTESAGLSAIPDTLPQPKRARLWRELRLLGRPIHNSCLISQIALSFAQFRKIEIHQIPRPRPTKLTSENIHSLKDTIRHLGLSTCEEAILSKISAQQWSKMKPKFKEGLCAHAEVQLLAWYSANPDIQPGIYYFGCSKRTCLLCEAFMSIHSPTIFSRGRHGSLLPRLEHSSILIRGIPFDFGHLGMSFCGKDKTICG